MNVWTIVLMIVMVAVIAGVVIYFDWSRKQQPTPSERLGSGIGDVVTSVAQLIGGARL